MRNQYHKDPCNYYSGIIISIKTRSERQLLRLKQINIQLATKIQHLEFSCSEKVRIWLGKCPLSAQRVPSLQLGAPPCQACAHTGPLVLSPLPWGTSS